jgi:hypothetical protein
MGAIVQPEPRFSLHFSLFSSKENRSSLLGLFRAGGRAPEMLQLTFPTPVLRLIACRRRVEWGSSYRSWKPGLLFVFVQAPGFAPLTVT